MMMMIRMMMMMIRMHGNLPRSSSSSSSAPPYQLRENRRTLLTCNKLYMEWIDHRTGKHQRKDANTSNPNQTQRIPSLSKNLLFSPDNVGWYDLLRTWQKTVKMRSECSMKMPMTIVSYQVVVSPLPWTHNGIALSLAAWKKNSFKTKQK